MGHNDFSAVGSLFLDRLLVERVKGIEPSYLAWEANVLPLNYTREYLLIL